MHFKYEMLAYIPTIATRNSFNPTQLLALNETGNEENRKRLSNSIIDMNRSVEIKRKNLQTWQLSRKGLLIFRN